MVGEEVGEEGAEECAGDEEECGEEESRDASRAVGHGERIVGGGGGGRGENACAEWKSLAVGSGVDASVESDAVALTSVLSHGEPWERWRESRLR